MPLDPNIILQSQTPLQLENQSLSLAEMNQRLQLGQQQMQLNNQDLQAAQLQNQMRQQQFQDQQTLRQAFIDSQGDPNQLMTLARQRGVSPATLMQLQTNLLDMKTKAATLDKDTLNNQQSRNDQLQSLLGPVASETDQTKQQAAWNEGMQTAIARGLIPPQEALQHPYPGPDGVKAYVASLNLHNWSLSEQQSATATWRAGLAQNEAAAAQNAQTSAALQRGAKQLSQATDPISYAQAYGAFASDPFVKNNPGLLNYFDAPKDFNAQTSPKRALQAGMTPDQIAVAGRNAQSAAETAQRDAETVRYHNAVIAQGNTRLDQGQERIDNSQGNGGGVQGRANDKSANQAAEDEQFNDGLRNKISSALQDGNIYIKPNGDAVSFDKMIAPQGKDESDEDYQARFARAKAGLQANMRVLYNGATQAANAATARKNNAILANGGTPGVSTQQAIAARNGGQIPAQAATPQPAAPAPQKPAAAPTKPAATPTPDPKQQVKVQVPGGWISGTRAQVESYLAKKGLRLQQ